MYHRRCAIFSGSVTPTSPTGVLWTLKRSLTGRGRNMGTTTPLSSFNGRAVPERFEATRPLIQFGRISPGHIGVLLLPRWLQCASGTQACGLCAQRGFSPLFFPSRLQRTKTRLGAQTSESVFRPGCALRGVNSARRLDAVSSTWPIESLPRSQADLNVAILPQAKVEGAVRASRSCVRRKRRMQSDPRE